MDTIGVIGLSWRHASPTNIARFTVPVEERATRLPEIAEAIGAKELVYIATCNRVDVAVVADAGTSMAAFRPRLFSALSGESPRPGEAERTFHAWVGEGAAEHLALVASGLDSARIGETEVLRQVRDAYEAAQKLGLAGTYLDLVLEEVLRIAARVHRATGVGSGRVSLAEIAVDRVRSRLRRTPGATVLVGVSPMTVRCARSLAPEKQPLVFVNRTIARAEEAAKEVAAAAISLDDYRRSPVPAEAIVLATGSPDAVLGRPELERVAARSESGEPPLVVDLAIPPDVDPEDARTVGVPRIGMEEIIKEAESNRNHRLLELSEARTIVDDALVGLRRRLADRMLAPTLAALHRRFRQTALEGVERLLKKSMKDLSEEQQEAIRQWAETLARRFAYVPSAGLRGLAYNSGADGVGAFLDGLDDGTARELRNDAADLDDLRCDPEAAF